jgi:RHS repeat-associated protein
VLVKEENGIKTFYVYGLGLIGDEKEGEYRNYHFDFRGSTVALTDQAGKIVERFQYGPYGELVKGDAAVTPFLFNGKFGVLTDSSGLYYMRARFYSAALKRFVNMDVLLGSVEEGQTLNRFAYGIGNPINRIDPTGYFAWVIIPVIPSIIEAIAATTEVMIIVGGTAMVASIPGDTPNTGASNQSVARDIVSEQALARTREIIRVRHHTSPEGLAGIMASCSIWPSRPFNGFIGVHVELPPVGPPETASEEVGAFTKGAFVEFDVFMDIDKLIPTPTYIGPRNTGIIVTGYPHLDLKEREPYYNDLTSWWERIIKWLGGSY